mgnify:CR=1 FL=1
MMTPSARRSIRYHTAFTIESDLAVSLGAKEQKPQMSPDLIGVHEVRIFRLR